jgi:thiol-disulfide isomerase/thioredoxin
MVSWRDAGHRCWNTGWKIPLGCFLFGLVVGSAWMQALQRDTPPEVPTTPEHRAVEWQAPAPVVRVGGWLNPPSGSDADIAGKVMLIDVWAEWCDPCVAATPGLVELYKKFKDRVVFVGVTVAGQETAEDYVARFDVKWPVGYDLSPETTQQLPGGGPMLYIVGRDGNVFWFDDRSRFRHKTSGLWWRVEQELKLALAEGS